MGIKERREREKQYVRTMILKIVNQIVADEGWSGVTIRKIAEEIEYSPPIIYEHFESKEALLLELTREAYVKLLKQFQKVTKDVTDPKEALRQIVRAQYDFCIQNKGYAKAILGLDGVPVGGHLELVEWKELAAVVRDFLAKSIGVDDPSDPRITDAFMQVRWMMRGGIAAAVLRLHSEKAEYPFNNHEKMKEIIWEAVDFLVEGWKRRLREGVKGI